MKKNFCILITLLIGVQTSVCQDEFFETWYKINDGDGPSRERVTISSDSLIIERLQDYQVDTPYWKIDKISLITEFKTIEDGIQIIGFDETQKSYTGGEITYGVGNDQMLFFQLKESNSKIDTVYKMLNTNKYKKLFGNPFYSKTKAEKIETYPSLDFVSKEEVITLFDYLQLTEALIDNYLEENTEVRWARMYAIRALENLRDHKFIEMGFNPYLPTDTYYGKRFEDDPDLIGMNEQFKYFKLF